MASDLHCFRELRDYRVAMRGERFARLDSFWFQSPDDLECRITHLVVRPAAGEQRALVPVTRIVDVSHDRHKINLDMTMAEVLHGGSYRQAVESLRRQPVFCAADLEGCHVSARDGDSGTLVDLLVDTGQWDLRYFELASDGRETLVDPAWTSEIDPDQPRVLLDLPRTAILDAPEFKPSMVINSGYCEALYRHYTRRQYMH